MNIPFLMFDLIILLSPFAFTHIFKKKYIYFLVSTIFISGFIFLKGEFECRYIRDYCAIENYELYSVAGLFFIGIVYSGIVYFLVIAMKYVNNLLNS